MVKRKCDDDALAPCVAKEAAATAEESVLRSLLNMPVDTFFVRYWEQMPCRSSRADRRLTTTWSGLPDWHSLLSVLRDSHDYILFKDQIPTREYVSAAAAYLDGCSVVVNHVEKSSGGVAALCASLRADMPHVFANLYLTPPLGQAVEAHADDRDVLVLQLAGSKHWRLLGARPPRPPIPFPMSDEQVGKAGLAVPQSTLSDAAAAEEFELHGGDVLYIPRGIVHEARTGSSAPSLHLTIAVPTHDWAWAKVGAMGMEAAAARAFVAGALARVECGAVRPPWFWRRSVPPALLCPSSRGTAAARAAEALAAGVEVELERDWTSEADLQREGGVGECGGSGGSGTAAGRRRGGGSGLCLLAP